VIDLKHELQRELDLIDVPDLWERIQSEASGTNVVDLRNQPSRSRLKPWLAAAAVVAAVIVAVMVVGRPDGDQTVDTNPAEGPATVNGTVLPRHLEFAEASASAGIGVPPGGGLTLPAGGGLGGSIMELSVTGSNGALSGDAHISGFEDFPGNPESDLTIEFECSEPDATDVILGGTVTQSSRGGPTVGEWIALLIREGRSATVWWDEGLSSCRELLDAVPHPRPDDRFIEILAPRTGE
jgi:hypothetical protein